MNQSINDSEEIERGSLKDIFAEDQITPSKDYFNSIVSTTPPSTMDSVGTNMPSEASLPNPFYKSVAFVASVSTIAVISIVINFILLSYLESDRPKVEINTTIDSLGIFSIDPNKPVPETEQKSPSENLNQQDKIKDELNLETSPKLQPDTKKIHSKVKKDGTRVTPPVSTTNDTVTNSLSNTGEEVINNSENQIKDKNSDSNQSEKEQSLDKKPLSPLDAMRQKAEPMESEIFIDPKTKKKK